MATVTETLTVEAHADGTITVTDARGVGVRGPLDAFLAHDALSRARVLVENLRVSASLSGRDPSRAADLVNEAKTWSGKAVR